MREILVSEKFPEEREAVPEKKSEREEYSKI